MQTKHKKLAFIIICITLIIAIWRISDISMLTFEPESLISFDDNGEVLSFFVNEKENFKVAIDLTRDNVPKLLQDFIVLYEDKRFFSHCGIDPLALIRTLGTNLLQHKRYGASTISMQTIKLGSNNKRTIYAKLREALQAIRLEMAYNKKQILHLYLDNAPYGSNIVGIKSAALLYFHKPISALTPAQSALLAVLPNHPNLLAKNPQKLLAKRNALLKRALQQQLIDDFTYKLALLEPLPTLERQNSIAPHYTMFLAKNFPNQKVFYTHINKQLQELLETHLYKYAMTLQNKSIANLAAIVLDAKTKAPIAYIGSQNFYDNKHFGQVDGIQARRNVGSTLKPFLYALSLDSGLIIPQTKLPDTNMFYGNFNPQNASRQFSLYKEAVLSLRLSLNAPFVALLQDYGVEEFFYFLRSNVGFVERDFSRYGLSLILGTKELSLFDLSKLYLGLRRGGRFDNIIIAKNIPIHQNKQMQVLQSQDETIASYIAQQQTQNPTSTTPISKEAAYITLQSLLDMPISPKNAHIARKIAWKSGTSFGNYDSWALGVSDTFIVGAWGGNFNAQSNLNLTGREVAGKLMFDIFGLLDSAQTKEFGQWEEIGMWSNAPKMREVRVDSYGYRTLDSKYSIAYMPYFAKPLRIQNDKKQAFSILYPTPKLRLQYTQIYANQAEQDMGIVALLDTKIKAYFFLNGNFIGTNTLGRIKLAPKSGKNTLYVMSEWGKSAQVEFEVLH